MDELEPQLLMKALKYDPTKHAGFTGWIVEEKFDGVSAQIVVNGLDNIRIFTNRKNVNGTFTDVTAKLPHVVNSLKRQLSDEVVPCIYHTQVYQGEILAKPAKGETREQTFTYITGTLNAKDSFTRQQKDGRALFMRIYNIPSMVDVPYATVIARIAALFPLKPKDAETYVLSPMFEVAEDDYHVMSLYENIVNKGGEGIVVYNPLGLYQFAALTNARTKNVIKIKDINEIEVLVTDIVEGVGKRAGTVGALICKDGSGREVRVGSFKSFNDAALAELWQKRNEVPFLVDIAYHSMTKDSYRNPRLVRVRTDKSIDDWNKDIEQSEMI